MNANPALLDHLAAVGYDPRYGARPLKRAMERELLAPLARQMNKHAGDTPLSVELGVEARAPSVVVRPLQGARSKGVREPNGPAGKLASGAQMMRRWHQLLAASSAVRELTNDVYQLSQQEARVLKKQAARRKLTPAEVDVLAAVGRLREIADDVNQQRAAAFALEDAAVVAFHDTGEPAAELYQRLRDANRDWDKLLLRLYGLSAPAGDRVTLALFSEHRGHLAELAAAYRKVASDSGLSVDMFRYDLPSGAEPPPVPPPLPPPAPVKPGDTPPPPSTVWVGNAFLLLTKPAKTLLKRTPLTPAQYDAYTTGGTIGIALGVSGPGSHLRFWGEAGLHAIKPVNDPDGETPDVVVRVSGEALGAYRPPAVVVRRGWFRDEPIRRQYDRTKDEMHDGVLERVWTNQYGELDVWVAAAVAANVRARLLKMIVE